MTKTRDLMERVFWTAVSVVFGSVPALAGAFVLDLDLSAGAIAAITVAATAIANALLVLVRYRLDALPNPGEGLPGLPTGLEV